MASLTGTKKSIVVILGHPSKDSFCAALAHEYVRSAEKAGAEVTLLDLSEYDFDPAVDPRKAPTSWPCIDKSQEAISAANHVVWVYPVWWGSCPALLKGFVDRTFRTGYAYRMKPNGLPEGLLKGKTSRILITMGSPSWWHRMVYRGSGINWLRWATLWFSGFKVSKTIEYCGVDTAKDDKRQNWLKRTALVATADAR